MDLDEGCLVRGKNVNIKFVRNVITLWSSSCLYGTITITIIALTSSSGAMTFCITTLGLMDESLVLSIMALGISTVCHA